MKYNKLRGRIVEIYGTNTAFADKLGIAPQALSRKLTGNVGFSQTEVLKWCDLLQIEQDEIGVYFFTPQC